GAAEVEEGEQMETTDEVEVTFLDTLINVEMQAAEEVGAQTPKSGRSGSRPNTPKRQELRARRTQAKQEVEEEEEEVELESWTPLNSEDSYNEDEVIDAYTYDSKGAELHVADQVHKFAYNAERRYRRALKWIEMDKKEDRKLQLEQATLRMRLAKAMSLRHMRFGENPEPATDDEKAALKESQDLLAEVLQVSEALNNASIRYECMKMNLQVCIQAENVTEARKVLTQLQEDRPDDEDLKSDNARPEQISGGK
ncbi:unnamed protein product, partial [Effrenium voratum]